MCLDLILLTLCSSSLSDCESPRLGIALLFFPLGSHRHCLSYQIQPANVYVYTLFHFIFDKHMFLSPTTIDARFLASTMN